MTVKSTINGQAVWRPVSLGSAAFIIAAPIIATCIAAFNAFDETQLMLSASIRYFTTTLLLCTSVGVGAAIIGATSAAIISLTEFPGRRVLSVLLALPFAIPAYVAAYSYADFLGPFVGLQLT